MRSESIRVTALVEAGWGLQAVDAQPLTGGLINRNWRVTAADGARWFLKEYAPDLAPSAAPTLRLQEWVRAQGLPVPAIRRTRDGQSVFRGDPSGPGAAALSTFEPGWSLRPEELTPDHLSAAGSTLARLHTALGSYPGPVVPPQPPPGRVVLEAQFRELRELVQRRPFSPEVDDLVLCALETKREALARWLIGPELYQGAAWHLLHRDYRLENLLFDENGQVTAVVDFDFAREGYRAWEVMRAAMTATWREGNGMDLHQATPLMEAYLQGHPIPGRELRNLGRLWLDYLVRAFWPMSVPYEDPNAYQPGLVTILEDRDSYTRWLCNNLPVVEDWLASLAGTGEVGA